MDLRTECFSSQSQSNHQGCECGVCGGWLNAGQAFGFDHDLLAYVCGDCVGHTVVIEHAVARLTAKTGIRWPHDVEVLPLLTQGR